MTKPDRKARHKALLREIAKLIDQPVDALATRLMALARLKLDTAEVQLLSGDPTVTMADIRELREVFDTYVPPPAMEIRVTYADGTDSAAPDRAAVSDCVECRRCHFVPTGTDRWPACPKCGWRHGDDHLAPWTALIAETPLAPQNAPATSVSPANVLPLKPVTRADEEALEAQKAELAAQRRRAARVSNGVDPGPPAPPRPNYSYGPMPGDSSNDSRSISQFMRDCDAAYRSW